MVREENTDHGAPYIIFYIWGDDHMRSLLRCRHAAIYPWWKLQGREYMRQYFIGHYNPRGNHFFAYAIKDSVIDWLEPKPVTYRTVDADAIDFKEYLPEYR
jgi:hypothetical protein